MCVEFPPLFTFRQPHTHRSKAPPVSSSAPRSLSTSPKLWRYTFCCLWSFSCPRHEKQPSNRPQTYSGDNSPRRSALCVRQPQLLDNNPARRASARSYIRSTMNSEEKQQLQSLTDFWKEPWTASTWGAWSSQNPAAQGLQPSSWMYTSELTFVCL